MNLKIILLDTSNENRIISGDFVFVIVYYIYRLLLLYYENDIRGINERERYSRGLDKYRRFPT